METRPNRPAQECTVAVIGGGFTGATLAAQLVRHSGPFFSIVVVEKSCLTGRGVAYGTECRSHLLNVPANDMSAFPEDREHFLRWAKSNMTGRPQGTALFPARNTAATLRRSSGKRSCPAGAYIGRGMRPVPSLPTAMAESKFACEVGREFWRKRWSSR
jgi:FAD-NAD(P)-binding